MTTCSALSRTRDEPLAGTAPRANAWVVVEHPRGWGDAPLARLEHGVRVVMARGAGTGATGPRDGPVRVWVGHCGDDPVLRVGTVAAPEEVADWDLADIGCGSLRTWGRPDADPLLLVCANARRDPCCGHAGRRLATRLWQGPHRDRVLTCTHLGGHRFAPTSLLLPWGVLHGRLDEDSAAAVLDSARGGRTPTATLRGFSTHTQAQQVADARARALLGFDLLTPMDVTPQAPAGDAGALRASVPIDVSGHEQSAVDVRLVRRESLVAVSCGRPPEAVSQWEVEGTTTRA